MKKLFVVLLALACLLTLAACGCEHEWEKANCTTPKTCTLCGETEGEALGHDWEDADCVTPKTCTWCDETEGEALGHNWADATCAAPKTCLSCGETEGDTLEHTWQDATTEAPKTCAGCGATEGERIITDPRFTTASTQSLYGKWQTERVVTAEDMQIANFNGELRCSIEYTFGNAGDVKMTIKPTNTKDFEAALTAYLVDTMYAEFTNQGLDKASADAAMLSYYGVSVADYCAAVTESLNVEQQYTIESNNVYYVADGKIYLGESWTSTMDPSDYTLENGKLTISENDNTMVLTLVTE